MIHKQPQIETRICKALDCDITFECAVGSKKRFCTIKCSCKNPEVNRRKGLRKHAPDCTCCICKNKRHESKSEEHKKKIGDALRGKDKPEDFPAKISKSRRENPHPADCPCSACKVKRGDYPWAGAEINKTEAALQKILDEMSPGGYKFIGDFSFLIGTKSPDFIHHKQKKLIEMFGDYWHGEVLTGRTNEEEEKQRMIYFAKYGYQTLIIWEHELKDPDLIAKKVALFSK